MSGREWPSWVWMAFTSKPTTCASVAKERRNIWKSTSGVVIFAARPLGRLPHCWHL